MFLCFFADLQHIFYPKKIVCVHSGEKMTILTHLSYFYDRILPDRAVRKYKKPGSHFKKATTRHIIFCQIPYPTRLGRYVRN